MHFIPGFSVVASRSMNSTSGGDNDTIKTHNSVFVSSNIPSSSGSLSVFIVGFLTDNKVF